MLECLGARRCNLGGQRCMSETKNGRVYVIGKDRATRKHESSMLRGRNPLLESVEMQTGRGNVAAMRASEMVS